MAPPTPLSPPVSAEPGVVVVVAAEEDAVAKLDEPVMVPFVLLVMELELKREAESVVEDWTEDVVGVEEVVEVHAGVEVVGGGVQAGVEVVVGAGGGGGAASANTQLIWNVPTPWS